MPTTACPQHGIPWKLVPAGTAGPHAKNPGKPYPAFYACEIRGCTEKPPKNTTMAPDPVQTPTTPSYAGTAPFHPKQKFPQAPGTERVPDQVWEAKDRTFIAQTSVNVAATVHQGLATHSTEIIAYAENIYTWILARRRDGDQDAPPILED